MFYIQKITILSILPSFIFSSLDHAPLWVLYVLLVLNLICLICGIIMLYLLLIDWFDMLKNWIKEKARIIKNQFKKW